MYWGSIPWQSLEISGREESYHLINTEFLLVMKKLFLNVESGDGYTTF